MNLTTLLEMVASGNGDTVLIGSKEQGLTGEELRARASAGAKLIQDAGSQTVVYLGGNGPAFPVALFAAAYAAVPFLPLNYRLSAEQIDEILARQPKPFLISDDPLRTGHGALSLEEFLNLAAPGGAPHEPGGADGEDIAVLLMTSGTTAAPKSAVLRHRHLTSYVLGSVEFASAEPGDATIVCVPPYHIAAVANLISNLYAGRRVVYLDHFTAADWLDIVTKEQITNAMVVPTMLVRIVRELDKRGTPGPGSLRGLSYGGAKIAATVLADALRLFPTTGFVNAYGLTETASSIAVLGPEDHRDALASEDPHVRARLASVGRALPGVEIEIHDPLGRPCAPGVVGDIVVRGPQIAGEYKESGSLVDPAGWFHTRDLGHIDGEGFIFVQGRSDDTIIRGGENIAPAEIEDVLARHPAVADVAVAAIPHEEWGQGIGAFVVLKEGQTEEEDELKNWVRSQLRSSKTPDLVRFVPELPTTPTGKILRRDLVRSLATEAAR
ncbi:class I adenylate-forming enzyme family protein [Arthrobacter sp. AZCC_0090]|uniref:class I adenylate-forming enzyme family protein n=1 Tax=Arthrobacter sp. AZCC_0090 TaxID=2735881 RepID=UPI001619A827|nr:fatty acid--CoA ligase family protein [Arthrobacter sp. AZCC_0090]MBB6406279.1 acyl-CoA synthetase (AMP-forming)/AMP-acid ligase II [Arthrobacter sp. AZCC_0090]